MHIIASQVAFPSTTSQECLSPGIPIVSTTNEDLSMLIEANEFLKGSQDVQASEDC